MGDSVNPAAPPSFPKTPYVGLHAIVYGTFVRLPPCSPSSSPSTSANSPLRPPSPACLSLYSTNSTAITMPRPAGGEAYETSSATDPEMHQTHTASPQASDRDSNPKKRCLASSAFTRRKRAVTACQFCRLRKAKCDAVRPICGFCRHHNANCTYDRHDVLHDAVADGSESGKTDLSEQILHRLAEIKVLLQDQQVQRTRAAAAKSPSLTASTPVLNSAEDFGSIPLPLGSLQSPHPGSQPPYPATRCESILRWPVFGAFHDTYAEIQSFLFTSSCDESSVCDSPQAHSSSIRNISQYSTTRTIDEDAIVLLCRKFLVYVYPRNPILEKEELMTYAKDIAANGLRWNASSCLVVLFYPTSSFRSGLIFYSFWLVLLLVMLGPGKRIRPQPHTRILD